MQMVELKKNMIINIIIHLENAFDRTFNHPLIRKYSCIPVPNLY